MCLGAFLYVLYRERQREAGGRDNMLQEFRVLLGMWLTKCWTYWIETPDITDDEECCLHIALEPECESWLAMMCACVRSVGAQKLKVLKLQVATCQFYTQQRVFIWIPNTHIFPVHGNYLSASCVKLTLVTWSTLKIEIMWGVANSIDFSLNEAFSKIIIVSSYTCWAMQSRFPTVPVPFLEFWSCG